MWAVAIFLMSAKSGLELDTGTGVLSMVKRWLGDALSAWSGHPVDPSPIGHFAEYFVLGCLLANAMRFHVAPNQQLGRTRIVAFAAILAAAYAATDEFHQLFVPGRACDPADWLVDIVAATLAAALFCLVFRKRNVASGK